MAKKKASPVKKTVTKKTAVKTSPKKKASAKKIKPAPKGSLGTKKVVSKPSVKKVITKPAGKVVTKKKAPAKSIKKVVKTAPKKSLGTKKIVQKAQQQVVKPKAVEKKIIKDATQLLSDAAVEGILEVKGRNITIMDLRKIHNRVCDYYIICQADSNTQVNAIAGSVEETVKKMTGERPYRSEGFQNSEWILVDYVTVVVHIFQSQIRNFYNLESLWADAEITELAFD